MPIEFYIKDIEEEYNRWINYFGSNDPYATDVTIGILDVLKAHFLIADYFLYYEGEGISAVGPRDPNLLHSAVYRQFVSYGGFQKWNTAFQKTATLLFGIIKDHPFHDANKRTGLLILLYFLERLNRVPTINQKELERFIIRIADNGLIKFKPFKSYQKKEDSEVNFIADFIKRKSRKRNNRYYTITYQQLNNLLKNFGYSLDNPHGNFIDIYRIETRKTYFMFGSKKQHKVFLGQIGFPGWSKQVGKKAISTVRRVTKLTSENGVDSETFFKGADPLYALISQYQAPLKRLSKK